MTLKETANELVFRFLRYSTEECTDLYPGNQSQCKFRNAKECALIAVGEIIKELSPLEHNPLGTYTNPKIEHWQEVKQELEKL